MSIFSTVTGEHSKISNTTVGYMLALAIILDGIQLLIGLLDFIFIGTPINWALNVIIWPSFYLWFRFNGIDMSTAKRFLTVGIMPVIEVVPVLNSLCPTWTIMVFVVIGSVRAEEELLAQGVPIPGSKGVGKAKI